MNRESKRVMKKQQAQAERERVRSAPIAGRRNADEGPREGRIKRWRRFLKEVRFELKKVSWPNRQEVATYTVVVVVTVTFLTGLVFALDIAFANTILKVFK